MLGNLSKFVVIFSFLFIQFSCGTTSPKSMSASDVVTKYIESLKKRNFNPALLFNYEFREQLFWIKEKNYPDYVYKKKEQELAISHANRLKSDILELCLLMAPNYEYKIVKISIQRNTKWDYDYCDVYVEINYPDIQSSPFYALNGKKNLKKCFYVLVYSIKL